jgi:hypothetical protein
MGHVCRQVCNYPIGIILKICFSFSHNVELHYVYSSPNILVITIIKLRRSRRARHVALMGDDIYIRFQWEIHLNGF